MATRGASQQAQDALPLASGSSVLARADVERRFKAAKPGEKIIWASGPEIPRGETSAYVADLYRGGVANLFQPRAAGGFEFIVQKRHSLPAAQQAEEVSSPITDAVLRALKRAANMGDRCPTDIELARCAGLATRDQAAWQISKLKKAGTIKVDTIDHGPDAKWRTVTIVETKKQTMLPPSLRELKRSVRSEAE